MKKYSMHIYTIFFILIGFVVISSCSKKMGCYYSLTPDVETGFNPLFLTTYPDTISIEVLKGRISENSGQALNVCK